VQKPTAKWFSEPNQAAVANAKGKVTEREVTKRDRAWIAK